MEESKVINNDNTYNTDMSTSQSTISGNATTHNKFNKDDLQEVTGGGGGGIATPPTTKVDGSETSQSTGTLKPILLILGDGTPTPDPDEEPVLLEEDSETTYKAVINKDFKSDIPIITFESEASSKCDANYVIAVTESDENTPVSYNLKNLSTTFTNDGNNWCSVEFKKPLEVTFPNKNLTADNFLDNTKIIVPVISCKENNGAERNTVITFNIGNFSILHNIKLSVTQNAYSGGIIEEKLTPVILCLDNNEFKIYTGNIYRYYNTLIQTYRTHYVQTEGGSVLYFGFKDINNNINGNIKKALTWYIDKFEFNFSDITISLMYNNVASKEGTSATLLLGVTKQEDRTIKVSYDGNYFCDIIQIYTS